MADRTNRKPVDYFADGNGSTIESDNQIAEESGSSNGTAGTTGSGSATGSRTESASTTGTASNSTVNPADIADIYQRDENGDIVLKADGTPAKKRGRKKGQTSSTTTTHASKSGDRQTIAVEMLAAQFQILNTGIAFLTRFDDFRLEDNEAMSMAVATANVMEQFDFTPDPKVAAVLGLVTTTSMIYGPRVYLYKQELARRANEKREKVVVPEKGENEPGNEMPWMKAGPFNTGQFN